jgi:hypothetical protein
MLKKVPSVAVVVFLLLPFSTLAQEEVDLDMVNRIRQEGFHNSEVMEIVGHLSDVIGPRLTGSPGLKRANEWTRAKLEEWGLENAQLEGLEFGRGWSFDHAAVHMVQPRRTPLLALPKAWTPGTDGPVKGQAMRVTLESVEDLEKHKGKLAGKILFLSDIREVKERDEPFFERYSEDDLDDMAKFSIPTGRRDQVWRQRMMKRWQLSKRLNGFLTEEKVLATVEVSSRDNGIVRVSGGGSREVDGNPGVPALVMATEHYNWIMRLMETHEQNVQLELNIEARFHDDDTKAYNTIAEIPGTDKKDELVMLGGHIDSWHTGTGATDNTAGVAVAMEAVRILKALGVRPRRTIRIGLWAGEEQGFLGSVAHVENHFAARPEPKDKKQADMPRWMRQDQGPLTLKPAHAKFSVYFNLDNGGGRIRGIYVQENAAAKRIFEAWLEPFEDLGAETVTTQNTGGTDHIPFDRVGLPGFQFIQDELDYSTRTHHTELDVVDHLRREDLMQNAVIMATFVYHAAMRDELMPRKPMPKEAMEKKATEN